MVLLVVCVIAIVIGWVSRQACQQGREELCGRTLGLSVRALSAEGRRVCTTRGMHNLPDCSPAARPETMAWTRLETWVRSGTFADPVIRRRQWHLMATSQVWADRPWQARCQQDWIRRWGRRALRSVPEDRCVLERRGCAGFQASALLRGLLSRLL